MVTTRAERRLAAIMATDIVGYSRLMETDEGATLAAIKALRAEVIDPLLKELEAVENPLRIPECVTPSAS